MICEKCKKIADILDSKHPKKDKIQEAIDWIVCAKPGGTETKKHYDLAIEALKKLKNDQHSVFVNTGLEGIQRKYSPAYLLKPRLSIDGDKWCALYGKNIQDGVMGSGDSPEEAYADFNRAWGEKLGGKL